MKTYEEFMKQVEASIKDYLSEEFQQTEIFLDSLIKNNNEKREVLMVKQNAEINLIFYLKDYYENYMISDSINDTLSQLASNIQLHFKEQIETDFVFFDNIKDKLILQLINCDSNATKLQSIPHKEMDNTDLTAVMRILVGKDSQGIKSILVNDSLIQSWEKSMEELYQIALQNTIKEMPFKMMDMGAAISGMMFNEMRSDEYSSILKIEPYNQYILTNQSGINGATVLLYKDLMEQIAEKCQSNFFILPSSIHELILIKDNGDLNASELQRMVMEVNDNNVLPEEILSYQVYNYNFNEKSITMATTKEETNELISFMSGINIDIRSEEKECDMEQ